MYMSAAIDEVDEVTKRISQLIKTGKPAVAINEGLGFINQHGTPNNAHFWFQMHLGYLLIYDFENAVGAFAEMKNDKQRFTPEMRKDAHRDTQLAVVRIGGPLTLGRKRILTQTLRRLRELLLEEDFWPNRTAVTYYAIARTEATLGRHKDALKHYEEAERSWKLLEDYKLEAQIDEQWRRDNRFRRLISVARSAAINPFRWFELNYLARQIARDDGELDARRKLIARILRYVPLTYWPIRRRIGP